MTAPYPTKGEIEALIVQHMRASSEHTVWPMSDDSDPDMYCGYLSFEQVGKLADALALTRVEKSNEVYGDLATADSAGQGTKALAPERGPGYLVLFEEPTDRWHDAPPTYSVRLYDTLADARSYAVSYSLPARIFEVVRETEAVPPTFEELFGNDGALAPRAEADDAPRSAPARSEGIAHE